MDPSFCGLLNWPKIQLSQGDLNLMLFSEKFVLKFELFRSINCSNFAWQLLIW